jgi:hypothetical protein
MEAGVATALVLVDGQRKKAEDDLEVRVWVRSPDQPDDPRDDKEQTTYGTTRQVPNKTHARQNDKRK